MSSVNFYNKLNTENELGEEVQDPRNLETRMNTEQKICTIRTKINSNDFQEFWELISRFESDFRRCGIFSNDSNFRCVRRSVTCNETVHEHVLWPLCTHTVPLRMLLCP